MVYFLFFGLVGGLLFFNTREDSGEKSFSELLAAVEAGQVEEIHVKETSDGIEFSGAFKTGTKFKTLGVMGDGVLDTLSQASTDHQTKYTIEPKEGGSFFWVIVQILPFLLIIGLFFVFMKQLQGGNGRAMSFGKSKAKLINENQVTFDDVAGADESKQELEEIVHFLKDPKKFTRLGGRIPKGVMLMGAPGTGKTLLARAVAGEAGVPFFSIAGSDFVEMFVGVGASRVRDLFEQGKKNAPCIIFIDEIDAVGRHRGAGMGGGHDEREQTLNQLLVEMDGFESNEGVIIIAATNRPDVLDPAIMRPGRFDRRVTVPRPDLIGREAILRVHTRKTPLAADVHIDVLARATPGMSGADLENLVNEAALVAARTDKLKIFQVDFEAARDKILMGTERRSMLMTEKDLDTTAYHEAGHALVSSLIEGEIDPVHKVTIIPRGSALGLTMSLPEDRTTISKEFAENLICMLMGGRIAEELAFNQFNSGAANDIERASDIARSMVCEWGMSEKMGPLSFGKKQGEVFLGRDMNQTQDYSNNTAVEIDNEVSRIVTAQYKRSRELIEGARDILDRMAKALRDYETIDINDIKVLLDGHDLEREKPKEKLKTKEQLAKAAKVKEEQEQKPPESSLDAGLSDALPEPGSA
ncbi:MAG: ATP-dependent metallopeptidase FtsH/Yme1/Tma family protein [Deltaproteobacteria bacterium]|nr:ATP-dependent metallopeptidase FtsH/Yme1/Tma family protein [Deltaproteobacteria bacterium]